jgi:pimeloyl-ACP methyl ester carboxylesterase
MVVTESDALIKREIVAYLERMPFERAIEQKDFRELLESDLASPQPLFPKTAIDAVDEALALRRAKRSQPTTSAFFSNKSVLIVPGFMGSQLYDDGPNGLIWIDPKIYFTPSQLSSLKLKPYQAGVPDDDAVPGANVHESGAVPVVYAGLKYYLESGRCEVRTAAFDWRKNIEESATLLVDAIQSFSNEHPGRPFFLIAHSQGSLVARRALQLLGKEEARRIVNRLILLGPASYGTFSAAFAIAGNHETIESLSHYGLRWPADLNDVLQSMSALYQMVPWKPGTVAMDPDVMAKADFWKTGVDATRLETYFRWAQSVDTAFFNDRTSIILGDQSTVTAVDFIGGVLTATQTGQGDGTVPDQCAVVVGVTDVARADGASHMTLPLNRTVMQTVWKVINANLTVMPLSPLGAALLGEKYQRLPPPVDLFALAGVRRQAAPAKPLAARAVQAAPAGLGRVLVDFDNPPPPPRHRRLKVFSFDPLLANDPDSLGMESIVLKLDWDPESADGAKLQPGPVGEYLEVVDYDPASRSFYAPVDLNHPNLLAQDGCPISETDPRFHQQMVYAVAMQTISVFEKSLGRVVQWSPIIAYDDHGNVLPEAGGRKDGEYVRRLRIYPHAMREANAYYDPIRKSVLFGYFPSQTAGGSSVLPRGIVFTCLSYDVIAHEVTHALLDGLHRRLLEPSNADVLAFHEAFADIVALFQHFSHPEVLRRQVAKSGGDFQRQSELGNLAQQFGEAMGMHGSLRKYLGKREHGKWAPIDPNPAMIDSVKEPHDRGAILVAAMFTAFLTIYRNRTKDLLRIASGGSGIVPPGDLHPDLVGRLADEAAKAARHLLTIAIRALDYLPPVDLRFGDYLQALITSDFDLIPGDHQLYRVSLLDAFRQWGIYPRRVRSLSIGSLIWKPPENLSLKLDMSYFRDVLGIASGNLNLDRATMYQMQRKVQAEVHEWMRKQFAENPGLGREWGLDLTSTAPKSIQRDAAGVPRFEVHSVRRCRRIGPDDQERVDILVSVMQKRAGYLNAADQAAADAGDPMTDRFPDFYLRAGATLIIDPRAGRIRYAIRKSMSDARMAERLKFESNAGGSLGLRGNYFSKTGNPFPFLHATEDTLFIPEKKE